MAIKRDKNKKIKVAFPHMGTISIAWAAGLRKIGVEPYVPPYTSKKTLSVAMITSPGICRLGEYGNNIYTTLKDLGYKANYIELSLYDGIKGLYSFLKEISGKNDPVLILRAINITIRKIFAIDDLDRALSYYRARELRYGDAEKNYKKALRLIDKADSTHDLGKAYDRALKEIEKTEIDPNREVLNVDLTGEIFLVNDEFSNQNIEFQSKETHLQRAERMAKPYLMRDIGGDALECVSDVVFADVKGKDGIIHISPFTCMPEIMSQNIFPTMRMEHEIPILPLIMDEQTGRAGYITRLEAFVDLMRRKKRAKEAKNKTRV